MSPVIVHSPLEFSDSSFIAPKDSSLVVKTKREIGCADFLFEMATGIKRGADHIWKDTKENIPVVIGIGAAFLLTSRYTPRISKPLFDKIFWLGISVSLGFMSVGGAQGIRAWQQNDHEALVSASTKFGVGVCCLGLGIFGKGVEKGVKYKWNIEQGSLSALGTLLHSPDEIAGVFALLNGTRQVNNQR